MLILNPRVNLNKLDYRGVNAFWISCSQGHSHIMLALAKKGIDIFCVSQPQGLNCLHLAARKDYPDIIKLLM